MGERAPDTADKVNKEFMMTNADHVVLHRALMRHLATHPEEDDPDSKLKTVINSIGEIAKSGNNNSLQWEPGYALHRVEYMVTSLTEYLGDLQIAQNVDALVAGYSGGFITDERETGSVLLERLQTELDYERFYNGAFDA